MVGLVLLDKVAIVDEDVIILNTFNRSVSSDVF